MHLKHGASGFAESVGTRVQTRCFVSASGFSERSSCCLGAVGMSLPHICDGASGFAEQPPQDCFLHGSVVSRARIDSALK